MDDGRRVLWTLAAGAAVTFAAARQAHAQNAAGYPPAAAGRGFSTASTNQRAPASSPALSFFGRPKSMQYTARMRRTQLPAPRPIQMAPAVKPYSGVQQASAISPYLALDAIETETSLPNYFMYVKPQLDMQRQYQVQQAQYQRLQQQLRAATAGTALNGSPSGGMPTTGHSAQFMNRGGYYPGLR